MRFAALLMVLDSAHAFGPLARHPMARSMHASSRIAPPKATSGVADETASPAGAADGVAPAVHAMTCSVCKACYPVDPDTWKASRVKCSNCGHEVLLRAHFDN
jgi:ribosomal protein S27AE